MMNFNFLNAAIESTNGNEFKVLYLICNTLSLNRTNRVKIYRELFAEKCNLTEKQITRITNELEKKGLIKKDIVSNGRTTKNYYSLNLELIRDKNVPLNNIKEDKNVPLTDTQFVEDTNVPNNERNLDKNVLQTPSNRDKNVPLNNIEYKEIKLNKINNINNNNILKENKNKKVEIKKDCLKMEFENELKNEFENEIEKIIPSNEKINLDEKKTNNGKLLNSSTLENTESRQNELSTNTKGEDKDISRLYDGEILDKEENTNTKAENSPRNALNLKGGQLLSPSNNKRSEGLEMANKTNNNNTKAKANDQKAKSGSGLSNKAADGQTPSTSNNKRSEGLEIALNPIFNVICDLSDQDKTEMNRAFEEEETNQFADEQEKAIFDAPRQQREYQEEQQVQKENALNYKEVFEEYEKKIKYCRNSVSLNAIYNLFKKYAQQVAQKLDGQELEQAAQDYDKVKQAKVNKMFSLKAKSFQF